MTAAEPAWRPPSYVTPEEIRRLSDEVLSRPDIPFEAAEDIFRLSALGLDWDIGLMTYRPHQPARIPLGADGKKAGVFLLHGAGEDHRALDPVARLLAGKFGFKVVAMSYPGRLNLADPSRRWPGEPIHPDGTVRTPLWQIDEIIGPDQYEVIRDARLRDHYGIRTLARAKPGTLFYERMAAWPVAFDEAMVEACRRHFPEAEFSIYVHAHSAGGGLGCILQQRCANVAGAVTMEDSTFGYINTARQQWSRARGKVGAPPGTKPGTPERIDPFNELYFYGWRDEAVIRGPEALGADGPNALMRLPALMEEVFAAWEESKHYPNFKAEYPVTHDIRASLTAAARVAARRLALNRDETAALIARYLAYPRELAGPGVKPMPPQLFLTAEGTRHQDVATFRAVILPMYAAMKPPPRTALCHIGAGRHFYMTAAQGLPLGTGPAVATLWHAAIVGGFFLAG